MDKRRELLYLLSAGVCAICHRPLGQDYQVHHGGIHDKIGSNANYPLYTQSLLCKKAVHSGCHADNPGFGHIPERHIELWESLLGAFKFLVKDKADISLSLLFEELKLIKAGKK